MSQPRPQQLDGAKTSTKRSPRKNQDPRTHNNESQYTRLGFLIHDVSRLRRNAFDRLMRPLGVTRSQWWVLAHVSRHDGMMQTELAELLDVGKVTLGGLIDRLEAGGWVVRRPDKVDRRVKRIFLTSRTDQLFKQMHAAESQLKNDLLKGITQTECDQLFSILTRMKHNLAKMGAPVLENGVDE